jgi:hypothetical protein
MVAIWRIYSWVQQNAVKSERGNKNENYMFDSFGYVIFIRRFRGE